MNDSAYVHLLSNHAIASSDRVEVQVHSLDAAGDAVGYRAALVEGVVVDERLRALAVEQD